MTSVTRRAPAKLNLTLEVLAPRADGYHEIRSVITSLSLADTVVVEDGQGTIVDAAEDYDPRGLPEGPGEEYSVDLARRLLAPLYAKAQRIPLSTDAGSVARALAYAGIRLRKRIPAAAGLGGGSSDATATLLALNEYWALGLSEEAIGEFAAQIGSDCRFFVRGGVQLVSGRGEICRSVPPPATASFCLLRPPVALAAKTRRLYALLEPRHFSDGAFSARLARRLEQQPCAVLRAEDLFNVFDAVADTAFGDLERFREALRSAGAESVHLCGAGPALYGLFRGAEGAAEAAASLAAMQYDVWPVQAPA